MPFFRKKRSKSKGQPPDLEASFTEPSDRSNASTSDLFPSQNLDEEYNSQAVFSQSMADMRFDAHDLFTSPQPIRKPHSNMRSFSADDLPPVEEPVEEEDEEVNDDDDTPLGVFVFEESPAPKQRGLTKQKSIPARTFSADGLPVRGLQVRSPKRRGTRKVRQLKRPTGVDLFPLLEKGAWMDVKRELFDLQRDGTPEVIRNVFTSSNKQGDSSLHIAAWKAPPRLFFFMVQMIETPLRSACLRMKDSDGNTPFHLLCANLSVDCADFDAVKKTLLLAPEMLDKRNTFGDTPLHLLAASDVFSASSTSDLSVQNSVETMVAALLEEISLNILECCQNAKGFTVLHIAIANEAHESVLLRLLKAAPRAAKQCDERDMIPLHFVAASPELSSNTVKELIAANPEGIYAQDADGNTPLHMYLSIASTRFDKGEKIDRKVTKITELLLGEKRVKTKSSTEGGNGNRRSSLVRVESRRGSPLKGRGRRSSLNSIPVCQTSSADRSPLLLQNNEGHSPLHICALHQTPWKLTRVLMESPFGDAASILKTPLEATALHLACESTHVGDQVENVRILSYSVGACAAVDSEGRIPLVVAVHNPEVTGEVVKELARAHPMGLTRTDAAGKLVLHHALEMGPQAKPSVVKAILKSAPDTANQSWEGNTPLHEACRHRAPSSVILALMSKYPDARNSKNSTGATPRDVAIASFHESKYLNACGEDLDFMDD